MLLSDQWQKEQEEQEEETVKQTEWKKEQTALEQRRQNRLLLHPPRCLLDRETD
jgi:hypothetical protein